MSIEVTVRRSRDVVGAFTALDHAAGVAAALDLAQFDDLVYVREVTPSGATVHTYYQVKHRGYGQVGTFAQLRQQSITPAETRT